MTASSSPAKRTFRHCASHQSAAIVARRGAPPAVASRSSTGLTPSGRAHGSSMENSANGTGREAACIFNGMIAPSPGGIGRATSCRGYAMVDSELEELRREFLAEADDKVHDMETSVARLSPESVARLTHLAHQLKGSGGSYGFQVISEEA